MRAGISQIVKEALEETVAEGLVKTKELPPVLLEKPKRDAFGDFATNIAMLLAPLEKRKPRDIAEKLVEKIGASPVVAKCEVAGPGFINIFVESAYWIKLLREILERASEFGNLDIGKGHKVQVEFVSANPTGPLHIGHGRGAAVGDTLANILTAAGFEVTKEYYINDVGRQMDILGASVRLRYLELLGETIEFPDDHYKGGYIKDIAREFLEEQGPGFKQIPEKQAITEFAAFAADVIMDEIEADLVEFGVQIDSWYSERTIFDKGLIERTMEELNEKGVIYGKDGATWFKTTDFGDDKDRVIIKADGTTTYFASDIAYHGEKLDRGFDTIIDVWGADHHGYLPRIKALFQALGKDEKALKVVFIQLVSLVRNGKPVSMSTRAGEFIRLKALVDEVGKDACRFFFLMRKADAHLDFDIDLARKHAPENPVYYVQYCHARIASIMEHADKVEVKPPEEGREYECLARLDQSDDIKLIKKLVEFEEVVERSATTMEPHSITFYLQELSSQFHSYYNRNRVVGQDAELSQARLFLCGAVQGVISKGLALLGVSAPEKM